MHLNIDETDRLPAARNFTHCGIELVTQCRLAVG